jgi:hypothetical protein
MELLWSRSNPVIVGDALFRIYVNYTSPKGVELSKKTFITKTVQKSTTVQV